MLEQRKSQQMVQNVGRRCKKCMAVRRREVRAWLAIYQRRVWRVRLVIKSSVGQALLWYYTYINTSLEAQWNRLRSITCYSLITHHLHRSSQLFAKHSLLLLRALFKLFAALFLTNDVGRMALVLIYGKALAVPMMFSTIFSTVFFLDAPPPAKWGSSPRITVQATRSQTQPRAPLHSVTCYIV